MLAVFPIVIYFNSDCKIAVKDINILVGSKIKEVYLKTFNKNLYYSKEDKDIKVFIDFPREGESISGIAKISGAAIDINSNLNPGIDKVEIFLGGNAPEGELIKRLSYKDMAIGIDGSKKTISYINNIYIQFFNRRPSAAEFNYWIINLEYGIYSYYDVARSILDSYEFRRRELSDQYFLELIYKGLFNRAYDTAGLTYWLDQMKGGLDQDAIIDNFIDSEEFKIPVDEYYKIVNIKKDPLSIFRKEVGDKYGKQFYLSGFDVNFDSTKFKNGDYELYIYARSPLFGWDFKKVNICINN
jgi:hypothetical protein